MRAFTLFVGCPGQVFVYFEKWGTKLDGLLLSSSKVLLKKNQTEEGIQSGARDICVVFPSLPHHNTHQLFTCTKQRKRTPLPQCYREVSERMNFQLKQQNSVRTALDDSPVEFPPIYGDW